MLVGYIYLNLGNALLSAYAYLLAQNDSQLFTFGGNLSSLAGHGAGVGTPAVTSNQGKPGSGIG
jgi:hypothetical protein